ncbi:MAG: hypothetical protein R3B90_12405 [Planctomycetaceae bacterium]
MAGLRGAVEVDKDVAGPGVGDVDRPRPGDDEFACGVDIDDDGAGHRRDGDRFEAGEATTVVPLNASDPAPAPETLYWMEV